METKQKKINELTKRRYGTFAISDSLSRLAALSFAKRGLGNGQIIKEWHNIWPKPWCEIVIPKRIRWKNNMQSGGVLEVSVVNPTMNTLLMHHKGELIERINIWFGYNAIEDIRIIKPSYY